MTRFDRLMQSKQKPEPVQTEMLEINGAFACNYCEQVSDTAFYDPHRNVMIWKCQSDHKNKLEDVHLG